MKNIDNLLRLDSYSLSSNFLKNISPFLTYYKDKSTNKLQETKSYQISFHNAQLIKSCIRFMDYDILLVRKEDVYLFILVQFIFMRITTGGYALPFLNFS